jgi:hypothetical protein
MNDKQIKEAAIKREHVRVYDNMCLPARDIRAKCSDGNWVKYAYNSHTGTSGTFGWGEWERDYEEDDIDYLRSVINK